MEAKVYNKQGKEAGTIKLPESIFGLSWNADLVHQVATSMQSNLRTPIAHTKDRSEVSGTGKKPWRQKGTGRARHGSRRSPIWRTGGVTFGPRNEKSYKKKINKKMKAKALQVLLAEKFRNGQVLFVDDLAPKEIKTKEAANTMQALASVKGFEWLTGGKKPVAYVAFAENNEVAKKSFNNLPQAHIGEVANLNVLDLLNHKFLVIENPEKSLEFINVKLAK
jgi:large subunit ribosomal protein L4